MYNVYFPACGFGFWYELGILNSKDYENYNIYGSSSGSLICLLFLLDKEEREIKKILEECIYIENIINSKNIVSKLNLYNYSSLLCDRIIKKLEKKESKKINEKLEKIYIEVTEIKKMYGIIPYIKSKNINPKNLLELRELVISSCYVPILSYYKSLFYYELNNKYYIDGIFGNLISKKRNNIIKINSLKYSLFIPINKETAENLYNEGLNSNNKEDNIIIILLNIIYCNIKNLVNIMIYYKKNMI